MKKSEIKNKINDYLLEEKLDEKSKNTLKHYEHVINMFVDSLENDDVTKTDLMKFKSSLLEKYKPKTISNYIVIVNKFIKYVEMTANEDEFDFERLKKFYSKRVLKNIKVQQTASLEELLEAEDLKRMLRMAKKRDYEMYLIMRIFSFTGIRAEELKAFTVENLETNYIQVSNKGKIRNIILRNDLKKELKEYCKQMNINEGYVFRGKKEGTMLHHTTIYKRLKKVAGMCRGIRIDKVHPHSFRHLFAVKYIEDGGSLSELADILGHSSINTTMIYTRTTDKMKKKRLEKMKY